MKNLIFCLFSEEEDLGEKRESEIRYQPVHEYNQIKLRVRTSDEGKSNQC